ncbi:MAG: tetratricopeptide repeat protein [Pseudomonadaceae bacterium]|nr:tetratricopeptide repeat protein [Pseudomonadaceae bacterium]
MDNALLYLLLLIALGIGFALGRRERRQSQVAQPPKDYRLGLGRLLDDSEDVDVDAWLNATPVADASADTLFALGALLRRRGQVDQAIRVHQRVLSEPEVSRTHKDRAELELGQDYFSAGLLDRAERLFSRIADDSGPLQESALSHLVQIYERERDWPEAIAAGRRLAKFDKTVRHRLAHYCCELAELSLANHDLRECRRTLQRALDLDPSCGRAELLLADTEMAAGQLKLALKHLERVRQKAPWLASQTLSRVRKACIELADDRGYVAYLERCLPDAAVPGVIEELAEERRRQDGEEAAFAFLIEHLKSKPGAEGLARALRRRSSITGDELEGVRQVLDRMAEGSSDYRCTDCGFSGNALLWQCPSCHTWSSVRPTAQ